MVSFFMLMPARRAACFAVVGGWLFLPPIGIVISGLPDFTKTVAAGIGILLATAIFEPVRFFRFRPQWYDIPIVLFCICPIGSAFSNGLGLYDGISASLSSIFNWFLGYFIGRLYFGNLEALAAFCRAVVMGGLLYVPLCILEIRLSPFIMRSLYGIGGFQGMRLGGFRPQVFFRTGLELGMWMTAASLMAWWLWRSGTIPKKWKLPLVGPVPYGKLLLPLLLVTTVFCRSSGALALLLLGMGVLWISVKLRTRVVLLGVVAFGLIYVYVRTSNVWTGESAVNLAVMIVGPERAQSLEYRFQCEVLILERALERPVLGWSGWGRSAVFFDPERKHHVPTDGWWIIVVGVNGFLGYGLWYSSFALPIVLMIKRFPASTWDSPSVAPAAVCAALASVYMIDCLLNAFPSLIYTVGIGGLSATMPAAAAALGRNVRGSKHGDGRKREDRVAVPSVMPVVPLALSKVARGERYIGIAKLLDREGRAEAAIAAMRHALALFGEAWTGYPEEMAIRKSWCDCSNDLAWCLANHPDPKLRNPGEAVELARRASVAMPEEDTYWNTLGAAQFRAGDFRGAIASLERSIEIGGGTGFDHVFLAMAHARLGDLEQGEYWLVQAIGWADRERPGDDVMGKLCDEARSVIASGPAPAVTKA